MPSGRKYSGSGLAPLDVLAAKTAHPGPGAQGGGSSTPHDGTPIPRPVIFPPEIYPIPGARLFNLEGNATISNVAVTTLVSVAILASEFAVVRGLTFVVNNMLITSAITFSILLDGAPAAYGPVTFTPRAANSFSSSRDVVLRIPKTVQVVAIAATVGAADGNSYLVGATLDGHCWTEGQERAYRDGRV